MIPPSAAAISLEHVEVVFPGGTQALHPTTLAIRPGEFVVLLGPSGAGKSTLLRCLNFLVPPSHGTVRDRHGEAITSRRQLRRHRRETGMVFQHHQLIRQRSALDNVLLGRVGYHSFWRTLLPYPRAEQELALQALDRVGLLAHAERRVDRLSGGEQQRVGFARALAQQPRLLLADEPVASLDPIKARQLLQQLKTVCREDGITAVVSLHQVDLARAFADRIVGLHAGRIVYDGAPAALSSEVLEIVYGHAEPQPVAA